MTPGVNSSKVQKGIDQLFSNILMEQQEFNSIRPADADKKDLIKDTLANYSKGRGRGFIFNYLSSGRGHGPFTELVDGSVKFDLIGGIGVNLLGHSHPIFIKANLEAATVDTLMCGNLLAYSDASELVNKIVEVAGKNSRLEHFWYSGSGSFANDVALKLLWQKQSPKYNIIAFSKVFAGRSVATQNLTHNEAYREGQPSMMDVRYAPHYDENDPKNSLDKTLTALNEIWNKEPDSFAALTIELIQGEAGFIYGTKEYYQGIFKWAKEKGIYIWLDEIQTFGRTYELFAFQMFGLGEYVDIVTIGKALQCCGTLYTKELNPKPGLIAGTFNGAIASLKAGKKVVEFLTEGNFYGKSGRIKQIEDMFLSRLKKLSTGSCKGMLNNPSGIGTMIRFEVGDAGKDATLSFLRKLLDNGVVAFMAGKEPTRVRFLLPVTINEEHADAIIEIVEKTLKENA